jgi:hypothetical protein
LIANLSQAALAYRERIAEMEFNPVILHADGSGLTIADALITLLPMTSKSAVTNNME